MISAWTKHLKTDEDKERFKNKIVGSKPVLERLQELLKEIEDDQNTIERDKRIYDSPNWAFKQAHLNGYRECLRTINKLINLDQRENG